MYLYPTSTLGLVWSTILAAFTTPVRMLRCIRAAMADEGGLRCRIRVASLIPMGVLVAQAGRRRKWSHLHVHSCADAAYIALFARNLSGLPYSLVLHSELRDYGGGQLAKFKNAAFGVAVSQYILEQIVQVVGAAAKLPLYVAPMSPADAVFVRREPYRPPSAGDELRLVTCARLDVGKGHQDVLQAIKILVERGHKVRLEVLGEGPFRPDLEKLIRDLQLDGVVRLTGAVRQASVKERLERAHIFVLASHAEAIGVAIMEAMLMEMPVVCTNVGGIPELVRNGVDGILVPPHQPEAIIEAIARLATAPLECENMGSKGSRRVRTTILSCSSAAALAAKLGVKDVREVVAAGAPECSLECAPINTGTTE
jgi:colanic acid/amylovoran biosynthesis glycosyltransferase